MAGGMFTIIGSDGQEFGPASLDEIRIWIAQGRVLLPAKAKAAGSDEWRPLEEFADWAAAGASGAKVGRTHRKPDSRAGSRSNRAGSAGAAKSRRGSRLAGPGPVPPVSAAVAGPPLPLQALVDAAGNELVLYPQEYEGPLRIRRPIRIDFRGATVHARSGPVLVIEAPDVFLRHAVIEVTQGPDAVAATESIAIQVLDPAGLTLEDIWVVGRVEGIPSEEGSWDLPRKVDLGVIEDGSGHEVTIRMTCPVAATLISECEQVAVSPSELRPGTNEVRISVRTAGAPCLIQGSLRISTPWVGRRVMLVGSISAESAPAGSPPGSPVEPPPPTPGELPPDLHPVRAERPAPARRKRRENKSTPLVAPSSGVGTTSSPTRERPPVSGKALPVPRQPATSAPRGGPPPLARPVTGRGSFRFGLALAALALGGLGFYFGVHLPERRRAQAALLESQRQVAEARRVTNGRELAKAEAARAGAARGGLVVRSQPAAEVRVGAIARGQSPLSLKEQSLGKHPVQVRLDGYDEWSGEAEIRENQVTEVEVALKPSTGALEVSSDPAGLAVEVVSVRLAATGLAAVRRTSQTPAALAGLPVGEYEVTLRREGWPEAKRRVKIERGGNASARADFTSGSPQMNRDHAATEVPGSGRRLAETPPTPAEPAPGPVAPKPDPGLWTIPDPKLELRAIPGGSFRMGSAAGDTDERPVTEVTLLSFWLGRTEVTQAQWQALMGGNPSGRKGDTLPVTRVSWDEALEFCRQLTERERAAGRLPPGFAYTLPTEAQWEYACRAGTSGDYAGSLSEFGWYAPNSSRQTQPVGTKRANHWGLHDMHGNVFEWCLDWYEARLPGEPVRDPSGPRTGANRVVRGGAWNSDPELCRSSSRNGNPPEARADVLGFRVALTPIPQSRELK